jgi:hypothetical protein
MKELAHCFAISANRVFNHCEMRLATSGQGDEFQVCFT